MTSGASTERAEVQRRPGRPEPASGAVDARGLVKRYGSTVAVDGLSLTADAGEILGVLGPERSWQDDRDPHAHDGARPHARARSR